MYKFPMVSECNFAPDSLQSFQVFHGWADKLEIFTGRSWDLLCNCGLDLCLQFHRTSDYPQLGDTQLHVMRSLKSGRNVATHHIRLEKVGDMITIPKQVMGSFECLVPFLYYLWMIYQKSRWVGNRSLRPLSGSKENHRCCYRRNEVLVLGVLGEHPLVQQSTECILRCPAGSADAALRRCAALRLREKTYLLGTGGILDDFSIF